MNVIYLFACAIFLCSLLIVPLHHARSIAVMRFVCEENIENVLSKSFVVGSMLDLWHVSSRITEFNGIKVLPSRVILIIFSWFFFSNLRRRLFMNILGCPVNTNPSKKIEQATSKLQMDTNTHSKMNGQKGTAKMEFLPSNTKSQQCSKWIGHECFSLFARLLQINVCFLLSQKFTFFSHTPDTKTNHETIYPVSVWISCFYEAKHTRTWAWLLMQLVWVRWVAIYNRTTEKRLFDIPTMLARTRGK